MLFIEPSNTPYKLKMVQRTKYALGLIFIILPAIFLFNVFSEKSSLKAVLLIWSFLSLIVLGTFLGDLAKNKFFLKSVEIDPLDKTVKFSVLKKDTLWLEEEIAIADCKIKIEKNTFSKGNYYYLQFFRHGQLVYSQGEYDGWNIAVFVVIAKYYAQLKGIPFYGNTIEERDIRKEFYQKEGSFINN